MLSFEFFFSREASLFFSVVVFLFGLCVGSFFNVCIWRIPRCESIVFTPSHCPNCGKNIAWFENIPALSWIILRGRCSSCKTPISARYILVEILAAVLFVVDYQRVILLGAGFSVFIPYLIATSLFILTFFIDIKHRIIPDKITYFVIVFSLLFSFFFPESVNKTTRLDGLINSFSGMAVSIFLLSIFAIVGKKIFKKEALGWGDVKFMGAVGACFGLMPPVWFFTLFVGSILGVFFGACLILFRKKGVLAEIPFGPFLAIGGYVWILFGPELTNGYFALVRFIVF
ncbi:MAG: prepilin peptidase [Lentisphaerota bacterium]